MNTIDTKKVCFELNQVITHYKILTDKEIMEHLKSIQLTLLQSIQDKVDVKLAIAVLEK
jgi:hypothetical protein